jgi:hypothetical protein
MRKLLSFLFLVALVSAPLAGADLTKLKVVVTDSQGKPVDRADVIVKFGGRSIKKLGRKVRTSWEMRTTQEGVADIPELPKGKILIQVIAKNYQTFGDTFDVTEDERTVEVKLNPPQPQYSSHEPEKSD